MRRERNPDNNAGSGMEMRTHGLRNSGMGYSDPTTGSASGAGLSAQRRMSNVNAPLHDHDAYGRSPVSNRALAVPGAGAAYNTRRSRTRTDRYSTSALGAGSRYNSGNYDGYNAAAVHAGVGSSSAAAVAPPNQPPTPLSENAHLEGPYTPYYGGSSAGYSAYPAYPSISAVAAIPPPNQPPGPLSESTRLGGPYTPYSDGSNAGYSAYPAYPSTSAVAAVPTPNQPPVPLSESTRLGGPYNPYSDGSNAGYSAYPAYPSTSSVALAAPVRPNDDW
jgi:hypothetical protein